MDHMGEAACARQHEQLSQGRRTAMKNLVSAAVAAFCAAVMVSGAAMAGEVEGVMVQASRS
jgi:hypothetical protein